MTPTKLDSRALALIVRTFHSVQDSRKRDLLAQLIMDYPDQYIEFVDAINKKDYERIIASA